MQKTAQDATLDRVLEHAERLRRQFQNELEQIDADPEFRARVISATFELLKSQAAFRQRRARA